VRLCPPPAGGAPAVRRGSLAAAAIAVSVVSLSACGAGADAQTLEVKPDNAATSVGDIKVQNATIITQPDLKSTGPAVVSATLFNNGRTDQTLESITVNGTGKTAELKPAKGSGPVTVPAGGSVILGGKGNATAVLPRSREAVRDGNAQPVTFTFSKTGAVKLTAFVQPSRSYFSKWGPSQMPTPPASKKPAGSAADAAGSSAGSSSDTQSGATSGLPGGDTPTDEANSSLNTGGNTSSNTGGDASVNTGGDALGGAQ
jgi:hypothetical protein